MKRENGLGDMERQHSMEQESAMENTMEKQDNRLLHGKIAPELLRFALPFMLASFLQSVYGAVDLFVVGRYTGSAAVSAVSIGSQLMLIATILVQGICMGGTVLIGQRVGEENWAGAADAVGNQCVLFAGLALVLTPVMLGGQQAAGKPDADAGGGGGGRAQLSDYLYNRFPVHHRI